MSDTALPVIVRFDTTANRLAFTPTPGIPEQLYIWLDSDDQPSSYYWDGATWQQFASGAGDVAGPAGATDEALTRFDGATGKLIQNSNITLSDTGALTFPDDVRQIFNPGANNAGLNTGTHTADPATPSVGDVFYDSVLKRFRLYTTDGFVNISQSAPNLILNGSFRIAQRFTVTTLTTFSDTASRTYSFDRWSITNENASIQAQGTVLSNTTSESGLDALFYGTFSKITNTGKICISQPIEGGNCEYLRGKTVRLQLRMKASSAKTMRVALLQLQAAGTVDVIPGYAAAAPSGTFISAFGADTTDPTFGTNLAKITPVAVDNATSANDGLSCSVTTAWQRFGGTFTLPSDFKNLILVVFTDSQFAAADSFSISEVGLYEGVSFQPWTEMDFAQLFQICSRYYTKSFGLLTTPAQAAGLSSAVRGHVSVAGATANQPIGYRWIAPPLRTGAPVVTFFNPSAANAFARNTSVGADATATANANTNGVAMDIMFTGVAGWLAGAAMAIHFTADAEF